LIVYDQMIDTLKKLEDLTPERRPILDDISIVIPTLGRAILENCLHSIAAGSAWPGQIIVAHQGLNPNVVSWIEKLQSFGIRTRHLPSSQHGRASAVNRGLEKLETHFVAVTDDDCFVDVDWLENMSKRLSEHSDAIISGRVEPAGDQDISAIVLRDHKTIHRRPGLKFDPMSGGNMGTSSDVVKRVGLFDEDPRLRCAEDGEWAYRALRARVPIIYAPEVNLKHYGWRDRQQRIAQYRAYARSQGAFYGKYLRKGDLFIALRVFVHHGRALKRMIKGKFSGNQEQALLGRSYFTGLLPGIIAGMGRDRGR
jgi:GT2 family glycosyltransferase